MKKLFRNITACKELNSNSNSNMIFSSDDILMLLRSIQELRGYDITVTDSGYNYFEVAIGDNTYRIYEK